LRTFVKNFLYILACGIFLTSCAASRTASTSGTVERKPVPDGQPRFLENITIRPVHGRDETVNIHATRNIRANKSIPGSSYSTDIEKSHDLQFKYAILMEKPVESVTNERLIGFLENWYGTPYRYGGEDRKGIDCSAFSALLMDSVYGFRLPRTARSQYSACIRIKKEQLQQGDLVFFNTTGGISHVGVYLDNNKFVHASASSGVMISDLNDSYFRRRYIGAARVR